MLVARIIFGCQKVEIEVGARLDDNAMETKVPSDAFQVVLTNLSASGLGREKGAALIPGGQRGMQGNQLKAMPISEDTVAVQPL